MSETGLQDDETITCQFCKEETIAEYNFCVKCDSQIKCIECGKKTFPGKDYCLACASPLIVRQSSNQAPNQYERKVEQDGDKYSEHTRFALSDNAVHEIAPFIIGQILPDANPNSNSISSPSLADGKIEETTFEDLTPSSSVPSSASNSESDSRPVQANAEASQLFQQDGKNIVATTNDFKGHTWSEQQKNFILLFVKAYKEVFGVPVPNKDLIRESADKLKIVDTNNYQTYMKRISTTFLTELSTGLILNVAGEKEVNNILKNIKDDNAKSGYTYWSRVISTPATPSRLNNDDKSKVVSWSKEEVNLGKLDIRDVKGGRDYALLSLWIITHHIRKAETVKWNEALLYLTSKYANTSVTGQAFGKAINLKDNETLFSKSSDGGFYLTTKGQKIVEGWISGQSPIKNAK